ncbi:unnamed protein product [Closterium sp. Naga37s-1]|nr:unnamed protein product [Closterium sp. Naga37s-1]
MIHQAHQPWVAISAKRPGLWRPAEAAMPSAKAASPGAKPLSRGRWRSAGERWTCGAMAAAQMGVALLLLAVAATSLLLLGCIRLPNRQVPRALPFLPSPPPFSPPLPLSSTLPSPLSPPTLPLSLSPAPLLQYRPFHLPPVFPLCTMDACFNFPRCPSPPAHEPLVYSYWPATSSVLISFSDNWSGPPAWSVGKAALMLTAAHLTVHRALFDVSLPLPPTWKRHAAAMRAVAVGERRYLLTFMGTRYLGSMHGSFSSSKEFKALHNGKDIIVVTQCGPSPTNQALTAGAIPVVVADN